MTTRRSPLLSDEDVHFRPPSSPSRKPSLLSLKPSLHHKDDLQSSVRTRHHTTYFEHLKNLEGQNSPTSLTKARRDRMKQHAEMEDLEWLRKRPSFNYQESEASDDAVLRTPSEYDPHEQASDLDQVSTDGMTPKFNDTLKSRPLEFGTIYGEDFEKQDWALSSRPRLFDPPVDLTLATVTPLVRKGLDLIDEPVEISQGLASMATERTTLNGKTLRPRSALSDSAAKLGFSPKTDDQFGLTHPRLPGKRTEKRANGASLSSRNLIRQQISTVTKRKRDSFVYYNRSLLLPLLPPKNYVESISGQTVNSVSMYKDVSQPVGLNAIMKDYQLKGLSFLVHMHNNGMPAILGDEMGLGKTLQTLSLFQFLKERELEANTFTTNEALPFLVICPLTVLENWVSEARKFTPKLNVLRFHGPTSERAFLKNEFRKRKALSGNPLPSASYDLVITTYEAFKTESGWFKSVAVWRYVVLDEGHRIKNYKAQEARSLRSIQAEYRMILTGTPLQNNLVEMWSLFHWILPDVFTENTLPIFKDAFDLSKGQVDKAILDHSRHLLQLIMLRRMKSGVKANLDLQPKEVIRLFVPLAPMQKKWYLKLLTQQSDEMLEDIYRGALGKEQTVLQSQSMRADSAHDNANFVPSTPPNGLNDPTELDSDQSTPPIPKKDSWKRLLNLVLQLRKVCTHPYLIPNALPEVNIIGPHIYMNSGKFMALYKLINELVLNQGRKMIIFSNFTEVLDWVHDLVTMISGDGDIFECIRLDGTTLRAKRNLYVRLFQQQDSAYKVFLISTKAGGVGLTLTAATEVVFMDEDWNPQVDLQAEARCHRIGQTKPVTIYKLCTSGSVEEQMLGRIHKKLYLSAKITEAMENIHDTPTKAENDRLNLTQSKSLFGNYSEFKSLLRRGTKTLASNGTDTDDLLQWDLKTMIQKCQQKSDPADCDEEVDEDKWLATMEKVECAVFEGQNYARQAVTFNNSALVPSTPRKDRHKSMELTVEVDGFAVSKQSLGCAQWESVPTLAGKDPSLKDIRRPKMKFVHQDHCQQCYEFEGLLYECTNCPRVYHAHCMTEEDAQRAKDFGNWSCFQHSCQGCGKKAAEAGGVIFRCRWCPSGFCEDCLDWDVIRLVGDTIDEYRILGFPVKREAYYIACPACNDPALRETFLAQEQSYHELARRADAGEKIDLDAPAMEQYDESLANERDIFESIEISPKTPKTRLSNSLVDHVQPVVLDPKSTKPRPYSFTDSWQLPTSSPAKSSTSSYQESATRTAEPFKSTSKPYMTPYIKSSAGNARASSSMKRKGDGDDMTFNGSPRKQKRKHSWEIEV